MALLSGAIFITNWGSVRKMCIYTNKEVAE